VGLVWHFSGYFGDGMYGFFVGLGTGQSEEYFTNDPLKCIEMALKS
jgi:hypothetical protein